MTPGPGDPLPRRALLAAATSRLETAGVPSAAYDAAELLAHVLGTDRGRLIMVDRVPACDAERFDVLVARRAAREPLQHLTGQAHFRHVSLAVGPGVFVPRPETELLAGWAIDQARAQEAAGVTSPVVLDLCTGSGAVAASIADEVPTARVYAAELDPDAHRWAERNLVGRGVDLVLGDLGEVFDELVGSVDIVVCNPPYVPLEAWESVAREARDHDPHLALFSGDDGLDAIRRLVGRAAELLRPGGVLGFEHADVQGEAAPAVLVAADRWQQIRDHLDLAGRPRYTTARLAP